MYSYAVAGANLFGQWFSDNIVIEGFERVSKKCSSMDFDLDKAKLVQANWSYNIFEIDGEFYLTGFFDSEDKQVIPIRNHEAPNNSNTTLVAGNDNNIVMVDAEKQVTHIIELKYKGRGKRVDLTEHDVETEPVSKKNKRNNQVVKIAVTNKACIYLRFVNREIKLYMGLIPHYIPTEHVMGRIIDVQCGYEHYMLLTDTGKVYTWGNGRRLQLGHGGIDNVAGPREVRALAGFNIKKIRAGGWHSAVVSEFGDLYMWGWNDVGQLGIKSRAMRRKELRDGPSTKKKRTHPISTVVNIYDEELNTVSLDVIDVCCGTKHTVILLSDYSVWAAGSNEYGQLGLPINEYTHVEHYVKVYQGTSDTLLRCGPWTTIIEN